MPGPPTVSRSAQSRRSGQPPKARSAGQSGVDDATRSAGQSGADDATRSAAGRSTSPTVGGPSPTAGEGDGPTPVREWVVFGVLLFAIVGVGIGLQTLLVDAIEDELLVVASASTEAGSVAVREAITLTVLRIPSMAIFLSAGLGAGFGWGLPYADAEAYQIAGASTAAGAAVCLTIATAFASATLEGVSLSVGALLATSLVTGLVVGFVAIAGVYVVRHYVPTAVRSGC